MIDRVQEPQDAWAAAAKRALDQSVQDLDQPTILRVQRARLQALEPRGVVRPWARWAGGLAAAASVAALAVTLWVSPNGDGTHTHGPLLEDLELVHSPENIELSEDLDFYDWLADGAATTG